MSKSKILSFYPKPAARGKSSIPLNLMAIVRMFDSKRFAYSIVNGTVDRDYVTQIRKKIREEDILCVGITTMTGYQIYDGLRVAREIKKIRSDIPIIWGGYHPTLLPLETLEDPCVDIVVKGQGEISFKEVVEALAADAELKNIKGIAYKNSSGELVNNPDRTFIALDVFPSLIKVFDLSNYVQMLPLWGRTLDYYTSQGCTFECGFCAENKFSKKRWVTLSSIRVVDEIEFIAKRYFLNSIRLVDSNFFVNKRRVIDICNEILRRNINIKFIGVNARIDTLLKYEDDVWELLYRAGFRELLVGAESGNDEVLKIINKNITAEDTLNFFDRATKYGFKVWVSLMIGIPGFNTDKELHDTVTLLDKMLTSKNQCVSGSAIFQYTPYPGSKLFNVAIQYGFKPASSFAGWSKMNLHNMHLPWVKKKYKNYVNYITLYILRRLIAPVYPRTKVLRIVYQHLLDPILKWRWDNRYFSYFFLEKVMMDFFNFLGALKERVSESSLFSRGKKNTGNKCSKEIC